MKKLFDFWSVPHFLFGVVMAMIASVSGFPAFPMFLVTLLIAIVWEFVEAGFRIGEVSWNVISDVTLPLIAFPLTFLFMEHRAFTAEHRVALLVVASFLYLYSNYIAWRARYEDHDPDFDLK